MNWRAAIFQERLFTLSIRYMKSDKLGQTNCDELLDNFVMKKAGQTFLIVHCVMFSLTWFDDCSFLFLYTYSISITTAEAKFKPVQSPRWALVSSALPNLNMKHYKSVKILSNFQDVKSPCENLSPLFKTFCWRFWFLTPHLFTRQFSCIRFLPVWKSKKHANSEQLKALEGFL